MLTFPSLNVLPERRDYVHHIEKNKLTIKTEILIINIEKTFL